MPNEILWTTTLDTDYKCTCTRINEFYATLTVTELSTNTNVLNTQLVLRTPFDLNQWEKFCKKAIEDYRSNTPL